MSILSEISDVHDGVLAPRTAGTYHDTAQAMLNGAKTIGLRHNIDSHDEMRKEALQVAIAAVQCMELASENIEKELSTEKFKLVLVADHNEKVQARYDELSGLTDAEYVKKAKDDLNRINKKCDYVEQVKDIIDKINQLPVRAPIETCTVHKHICGVDGGECNFKYMRYPSWHIMGEFDTEVSECRLSGTPKQYPTHLKHCEHMR